MSGLVAASGVERDPRALLERLRREGVVRAAAEAGSCGRRAPLPTGVEGLDRALGGGLPRGRVVEVVGPVSSGRTAFLFRVLAEATSRGEQVALIDPADAFDPDAAVSGGVVLSRVLWVRPSGFLDVFRAADLVLDAGGFGVVALDLSRRSLAVSPTNNQQPTTNSPSVWPRLALRAERSGSVVLGIGERRGAGTFAAVALGLRRGSAGWLGGGSAPLLLDRLDVRIELLRSKGGHQASGFRLRASGGGIGASGVPAPGARGLRSEARHRRDAA